MHYRNATCVLSACALGFSLLGGSGLVTLGAWTKRYFRMTRRPHLERSALNCCRSG
jgi:hypothetical protein